jgi:hypothetical protein
MEMEGLRQAIEKIEDLVRDSEAKVIEINGETYSTRLLTEVPKVYYRPGEVNLNTLDSLVDMIKVELHKATVPLFVKVTSPECVSAFTTYHENEDCSRDYMYIARAELPRVDLNKFIEHEDFMIALRSKFIESEDISYLLTLLASITDKNSVESNDDGISQSVQAKKGVVMVQTVNTKPRVTLQPYRTFLEVEQPASEFLLRLKEGGYVALFEADGGAWRLAAKKSIKEYLTKALSSEIEAGIVVVIA